MNYFELFNLEKKYRLDQELLQKKYFSKQAIYHPDKVFKEKQKYIDKSTLINQAYKTLKDDYLRAEYLIKLSGVNFGDSNLKNLLTHEQLEEILEVNDFINHTEKISDLEYIQKEKIHAKSEIVKNLENHFANNNFTKAVELTIHLKYLNNLLDNIKLKIKHVNRYR